MTETEEIGARAARLEALLAERLGLKRGGLRPRLARAGRRLPRKVRRDLAEVAAAAQIAGHPGLAHTLDAGRIGKAADRAEAHLEGIDPRDMLKGRVLGILGTLAFNLLVLAAIVLVLLRWRGLV